jgi:hypothetical protein
VFGVVFIAALVVAWRSADRVIAQNRGWTRAWRILVACIAPIGISGLMLPLGAIFILVRYGRDAQFGRNTGESAPSRS